MVQVIELDAIVAILVWKALEPAVVCVRNERLLSETQTIPYSVRHVVCSFIQRPISAPGEFLC